MSTPSKEQSLPYGYDAVPYHAYQVRYLQQGEHSGYGIFVPQDSGQYLICWAHPQDLAGSVLGPVLPDIRYRFATQEEYQESLPFGYDDIPAYQGRVIFYNRANWTYYGIVLPDRILVAYPQGTGSSGYREDLISSNIRFRLAQPEEYAGMVIPRHIEVSCIHGNTVHDQGILAVTVCREGNRDDAWDDDDHDKWDDTTSTLSFPDTGWTRLNETLGAHPFQLQLGQMLLREHSEDTLPFAVLSPLPLAPSANVLVSVIPITTKSTGLYYMLCAADEHHIPLIGLVPPDEEQARQRFAKDLKLALHAFCRVPEQPLGLRWLDRINLICRTAEEADALRSMISPLLSSGL